MRGRKPSAEHLRLVQTGQAVADAPDRPAKSANGVRQAQPSITAPSHLPQAAKLEYRRIARLLRQQGKWSELFRGSLAIYARAWADWIEADRELKKEGKVIVSPKGYPIQSAWLAIRNKAAETMLRVAGDMGLDLVSQVRVAGAQLDLFDSSAQADTDGDDNAFAGI